MPVFNGVIVLPPTLELQVVLRLVPEIPSMIGAAREYIMEYIRVQNQPKVW